MKKYRSLVIIILYLMGYDLVWCQKDQTIQQYLDTFVEQPIFKNSVISATVMDIESGEVIASNLGNKNLIPASSQKLVTTLSAAVLLSTNYRYTTKVMYDGSILSDGTLMGNLYIVGSGDPSLASEKIDGVLSLTELCDDISKVVGKNNISCIDGMVVADESIFNSFPISPSWQWNDLGNYYASGAWGININDNQYSIVYQQQEKEGNVPAIKSFYPYIPNLELQNEITTGEKDSGDNAYIFGGPYEYTKRIVGTIPPGKSDFIIKGSIPDPPAFLAYHLLQALKKKHIVANGYKALYLKENDEKNRKLIHTYTSPELKELIRHTNHDSDNMFAESILKTIGSELKSDGSGQNGILALRQMLTELNLTGDGLHMEDGSGLSARNRISSMFLADFIRGMYHKLGRELLQYLLPAVGESGTVKGLLTHSSAKSKIWAKSGSMESVISYSGFLQAKSGRWLSFSIICNGHSEKNKVVRGYLENYMTALYKLN